MNARVLALCVIGACSNPTSSAQQGQELAPAAPAVPEGVSAAPQQAQVPPDAGPSPSPIPAQATQLIVSLSESWTATDTTLHRFEREPGKDWQPIGDPIASTLGHAGLGWGNGLHKQAGDGEPVKREGDGRSPAGVFLIGHSYGYEDAPSTTALPYQKVDRGWRCVNDAESAHYNRVLDSKTVTKDWAEAERMRRRDALYELVIEVDHNHIVAGETAPKPGDGSCIFMHVWRGPGAPTIGCTAMPLPSMQSLLAWLEPKASPTLVALPRKSYDSLRALWGMPSL